MTSRATRLIPTIFLFSAFLVILAPASLAQSPDEGAELYDSKCARCHQPDGLGSPGVFPPLAGNPGASDLDYVIDVVTNGLSGKEILGVSYSSDMPEFGSRLTPEEIQAVSEYVVELSVSGPPITTPTTQPAGTGAGSAGEDLFIGTKLLSNGGVACVACHSAGEYDRLGGPGLAMDLGGIVDVYGTNGFIDSITNPVVDEMIAVFADHPITPQEAADLAAFLETTDADATGGSLVDLLVLVGVVGFLVLLLITAGFIRGPQETYVTKLRSTR
ncbi:MAG: cytochrome c [Actinomycetota bacterium]